VKAIAEPAERRDSHAETRANGRSAPRDAAVLARKRAFLLLEGHRESLAARVPRLARARTRYEARCLVRMVTRLQRDYLSQPTLSGDRTGLEGSAAEALEYGVADWARPWGPSCLLQLQGDMNVFDRQLKSSRRWLSTSTQRKAEAKAGERFAAIMARMAGDLKLAEFTLPGWASSAQVKSQRPPARAARLRTGSRPRRPQPVASPRVEPSPAAPRRVEPSPAAPRRDGPAPGAVADRRLDLNQVSFEQLRSLDLSITQCHRVLAYRKRLRGFDSIDQLDEVPGFPRGMREHLRHRLTV
jgi:Helix-hairpin-helix motif